MEFEIVEFYPFKDEEKKNNNLLGTIHIYLIDAQIDYRGIVVFDLGKKYKYLLPNRRQIDHETNKSISYPILSFTNPEINKKMISFLQVEGTKYIKEKILNKKE